MKYQINKGLIFQKLVGRTVIFDSSKSVLYKLNDTASFIFKKLKKGTSDEKIVKSLVDRYEVTEVRAREDLSELVFEMAKKKIISFSKPGKKNR